MIHVQERPAAPLRLAERPEHVVRLARTTLTCGEEALCCRLEHGDVRGEVAAGRCATDLLIRLGARLEIARPGDRRIERHPFEKRAADERRRFRATCHQTLAEEVAKSVSKMADHLRRGHAPPLARSVGA